MYKLGFRTFIESVAEGDKLIVNNHSHAILIRIEGKDAVFHNASYGFHTDNEAAIPWRMDEFVWGIIGDVLGMRGFALKGPVCLDASYKVIESFRIHEGLRVLLSLYVGGHPDFARLVYLEYTVVKLAQ